MNLRNCDTQPAMSNVGPAGLRVNRAAALGLVLAVALTVALYRHNVTATDRAFDAAFRNDAATLEEALKAGLSPNSQNVEGLSLLYVATGPKGGAEVLDVLIRYGAQVDLVGPCGFAPLMNAASWANEGVVRRLLEAGANPHAKNCEGRTAVQELGRAGDREHKVYALLVAAMAQGQEAP